MSYRHDASILGYLFARIGHECGALLRTMHSAGICWGTYQDAMCAVDHGEWHCNAHSNNFVVLSEAEAARAASNGTGGGARPGAPPPPLLACLDFDMAFSADTFVDVRSVALLIWLISCYGTF